MTSGFLGAVKRRGKPGMLVVGCWLFGAGSLHLPRSEFRVPDSVPPPGSDQGLVFGVGSLHFPRSEIHASTLYHSDAPLLSHPADSAPPTPASASHAYKSALFL